MAEENGRDSLNHLRRRMAEFVAERDWQQFNTPKNLSMALIAEAAELVEHFQWLTPEESRTLSPERLEEVAMELADILNYLVRLADELEIDLIAAAERKFVHIERRYPADRVRGSAVRPVTTGDTPPSGS